MIKIKSGVKLPPKGSGGGRPPKYPFANMKIGNMFEFPKGANNLGASAALYANKHLKPAKFVTRKLENGNLGCWRVK